MAISETDILAIEAKAVEIALRGVTEVVVGDRTHKFTDPVKLFEFTRILRANNLDDIYGGRIPLTMGGV